MPTLAELRTLYKRYAGQNNDFTERLNLVLAHLLPMGNWKSTKVPARFAVYIDNSGNRVITLPRSLETILAGAYQAPNPNTTGPNWYWCGQPIPIRNGWYEFSASGPGDFVGSDPSRGIIKLEGSFTTFCDWDEPRNLRVKLEQTEVAGTILLRGIVAGKPIYTTISGVWSEGVQLAFTNATVTTTQQFDLPPYEIIKSITKGRIQLYAVDDDDVETLVGYYEPDETNPGYARFKVPVCDATAP